MPLLWECRPQGQELPDASKFRQETQDGRRRHSAVNMVESVVAEAYSIDAEDDDHIVDDTAVQDGGAASVLGSAWQIKKYIRFLLEQGFNIHDIHMFHCEKGFKYGNSVKETTNRCVILPVFLGQKRVDVLTYVIQGTAPILVGRPMLERLGLVVDYKNKKMKWPDSEGGDLLIGPRGEHQLHLGKDIRQCMNQESQMLLLPEDTDSQVGEPIDDGIKAWLDEVMIAEDVEAYQTKPNHHHHHHHHHHHNRQPPTANRQPPTTNHQPPTTNHQRITHANNRPPTTTTNHPQPTTLNQPPSTNQPSKRASKQASKQPTNQPTNQTN